MTPIDPIGSTILSLLLFGGLVVSAIVIIGGLLALWDAWRDR
jgi:hypothetical protein